MRDAIRLMRAGREMEIRGAPPQTTLLDWLRLSERAVGTKEGCAEGDCGACTVVLRRRKGDRIMAEPVNSCITFLGQADEAEVVTIEELAKGETLHPIQQAMVDHHGSQCGFCTPGIVMSLFALDQRLDAPPTRAEVNDALAGNLCRCTGYRPIVDAALASLGQGTDEAASIRVDEPGEDLFVGDDTSFFAAPASEDSLAALHAAHPDAVLVAGATDIGLWVTKAFATLPKIVWLGRVRGLDRIEETDGTLHLGATVTHARALEHLAAVDPDLGELMRRFGSPQVRASGTVGGNIANGSPIGDLPPALIALGATLHLRRGGERRTLPLEDFFLDYRKQDRRPGEFVTGVTADKLGEGDAFRAFKVSKRFDEDISASMGAFRLKLDGRRIASARIAYGGMAATPRRAASAEAALVGAILDDPATWEAAIVAIGRDFKPLTDQRASAAYRSAVAANLLRKALIEIAVGTTQGTRVIGHREVRHAAE